MEDLDCTNHFSPSFPFGAPNQSTIIAKEKVVIKDKDDNALLSGNAEVRLDLLPRPRIRVHIINIESSDLEIVRLIKRMYFGELFTLELNNKKHVEGVMTAFRFSYTEDHSITFSSSSEPIIGLGDDDTQMQYAVFHLFNFKETPVNNNGNLSKYVHLEADNWVVELESLADDVFKKLRSEGGYGLTHVGCLRKKDNTPISGKEVKEMLYALEHFFSFAKGAWCNPVCAVGFNSSDRVWESWSSPKVSGFSQLGSWFDGQHSEQLENLFPGFMSKWNDADWKDTLHKVIYWYLIANNSNIDAGIVLTQTALERLYYHKLKEASENATSKPKDPDRTSSKLNNLFCELNLPIELIEENTPRLNKLADDINKYVDEKIKNKKKKTKMVWNDAPSALTGMRNYLVHPVNEYYSVNFGPAIYDANKMGLWYLELSLLKECGYSGTYYNRLTEKLIENVEEVPCKSKL